MENFKFLNEEEIKKEYEKIMNDIECREIIGEFLEEISPKGHKEVTQKIKTYLGEFLDQKNIKYEYVYYLNSDKQYSRKFYCRTLILKLSNGIKSYEITIKEGFENDCIGGFYDDIININLKYKKENLEKKKARIEENFENAILSINIYNQKLKELIKLWESFGYFAKH